MVGQPHDQSSQAFGARHRISTARASVLRIRNCAFRTSRLTREELIFLSMLISVLRSRPGKYPLIVGTANREHHDSVHASNLLSTLAQISGHHQRRRHLSDHDRPFRRRRSVEQRTGKRSARSKRSKQSARLSWRRPARHHQQSSISERPRRHAHLANSVVRQLERLEPLR